MGLDMYAFTVDAKDADDNVVDLETNYGTDNELPKTELFYWRKFNALHAWMEDLYRIKGGTAVSFNCNTVRLDAKDLDQLEMDTVNNKLVPVNGFFFGEQTLYPEDIESIADFIAKAREALDYGKAVYYDSWW